MQNKRLLQLIFIFIFFGFSSFVYFRFFKNSSQQNNKSGKKIEKTSFALALFGYGGGTHEGAYLTDTIMVVNVDLKSKKIVLTSIPRDLWVKLPTNKGTSPFSIKINALYQMNLFPNDYPGVSSKLTGTKTATLSKNILKKITGLDIDRFIAVDFQSFTKFIDLIGGIDVQIDRSFTDKEYPIEGKEKELCGKEDQFKEIEPFLNPGFNPEDQKKLFEAKPELNEFLKNATETAYLAFPCRYDELKFTAGLTHLNGEMALKFARSRHSVEDGGDFNRGIRQQKVIQAIKTKVFSVGFISKIPGIFKEFSKRIATDLNASDLSLLLKEVPNQKQYKVEKLVLTSDNYLQFGNSLDGQSILIPKTGKNDYSDIKKAIKKLNSRPTPTISQSIKNKD